ncbi:hypothetical protein EZV62_008836 [Acer yangbiense]|uniref:CASP-like protein n=1 Tax=Acer yangbiense TaxID=1000413 RepID=A0A5C7IEM2_9ROSI|nr:hypothetical protein EZV62_008836 [Acer yangbiense]
MLKFIDCFLRISVIPLSVATIWLTVTNQQDNTTFGKLKFSNLLGLKYMVCISAICAGYAFVAVVSSCIKFLVTKAWLFFLSDQIVAYLMVTSGAAVMEIIYLAYNGDQKVTWSESCSSYGKFCYRMKLALIFHALALVCFIVLAVISAYRISVIPLSVATIWLTVTNQQDNTIGNLKFSNLLGLKYMVCISAICAGYAFVAVVSSCIKFLVTKAWLFFLSDQIIAYLMVTSGAAVMEIIYLAYNGDQKVTWSESCSSYGKFCYRMKLALIFHALALVCFIVLAVISAYRISVIPLSVATIWLTVTNQQDNTIGNLKFSNLLRLKYMVCISAICAGYAFVAVV